MKNHATRRVASVLGGAALAVALGAPLAGGLAATASEPLPTAPSATGDTAEPTTVEHQAGVVLEGTADLGGTPVLVTVYDNSRYGSSIQVVLGDPDEGGHIGYAEQATPYVVDGRLDATVQVDGRPLTLTGTVTPAGRPTRLVEPMQDGGEQLITRGTNTDLVADVNLGYRGDTASVAFAPAFAFDLEVRRVTLYGN